MATDLFLIDYEPILLINNPPLTEEDIKKLDELIAEFKMFAEYINLQTPPCLTGFNRK